MCDIATGNKNTQDKSDDGIYPFYVRSQTVERINSWSFDGEAILTAGDGVGVGKVFHYSTGKIGVHQRVYILSNFTCDSKYLFHYFSSRFYARVKRMSAKNSVDSVRMEMIADMPIYLASKDEQIKIGNLLSLLDERIETQKKIIEDLKRLKYAISKRVFENHGSSNSMLLGKVADIYQPQTIPTSWLNDTLQYPVYGANGVIGKYSEYNHENSQICIACRGNTCGTVNYSEPKSWITGNAMVINTDRYDINKRFLFHQLCTVNYSPLISGSGQPQIVRSPLEKMKIWFPNEDIQERIATLFDTIEDRVLIEETTLILAERMKQYLLSQLFI